MEKTAFVTGGTGFIGINLIKLLIQKGWRVTALYRENSNLEPLLPLPLNWVNGSVTNAPSLLKSIPEDTDAVFHLAGDTNLWGKNNTRQTLVNVKGTENMIAAALKKEVPVFIHTSSVAAWGNVSGTVTEQTVQHGNESWINYERTKWAGERKALEGVHHGMKVVILNPANVIGPHDKNNWGRLFLALRDDDLPYIADGCVSIAHVENITEAHVAAVDQGKTGERYILAGEPHLFSEFVECINTISAADNMPAIIPTFLFRGYAQVSSGIASLLNHKPSLTPELAHLMTRRKVHYSSQKAIDHLNYRIPPMHISVRDCCQWLKAKHIL